MSICFVYERISYDSAFRLYEYVCKVNEVKTW